MRTVQFAFAASLLSASIVMSSGTAEAANPPLASAASAQTTNPAMSEVSPGMPQTWTLTIGGVVRTALVFAPQTSALGAGPVPVVFGFHGHGGGARGMIKLMGFQRLWPQALVIYPQGIPTPNKNDPQGIKTGWQAQPGTYGDRDLNFFDALLAKAKASFNVDPKRVYVVGFSNGANFSYLLWGERAPDIAAFGIAAGAVHLPLTLTAPRALFEMAGKTDTTVPFVDQMSTDQMVEELDGTGGGQPCGGNCTLYQAASGLDVQVVLHPGGHLYPTAQSANVVAFLQAHPMP